MTNELDVARKISNFKTKKLTSTVDFSALVSLSFLLIMFYMLTSAMSRPQTIDLSLPENGGCIDFGPICYGSAHERTITVLLGANNEIVFYQGFLFSPIFEPKFTGYGKLGIRKEILLRKLQIDKYYEAIGKKNINNTIVIIKPTKQCSYENLVNILDEMAIIGVKNFTLINDLSPEEKDLLQNTN